MMNFLMLRMVFKIGVFVQLSEESHEENTNKSSRSDESKNEIDENPKVPLIGAVIGIMEEKNTSPNE